MGRFQSPSRPWILGYVYHLFVVDAQGGRMSVGTVLTEKEALDGLSHWAERYSSVGFGWDQRLEYLPERQAKRSPLVNKYLVEVIDPLNMRVMGRVWVSDNNESNAMSKGAQLVGAQHGRTINWSGLLTRVLSTSTLDR